MSPRLLVRLAVAGGVLVVLMMSGACGAMIYSQVSAADAAAQYQQNYADWLAHERCKDDSTEVTP